MDSLGKFLQRVAALSTTYVDEAILPRAYQYREQNAGGRQGGRGPVRPVVEAHPANAVVLCPAQLRGVRDLPHHPAARRCYRGGCRAWTRAGVAALIGAWMLKLALSDAVSLAATPRVPPRHRRREPNAEWVAKLEGASASSASSP